MKLVSAIVNLEELVTVAKNYEEYRAGIAQDSVELIKRRESDGVGCAIVFDETGKIAALGHEDAVISLLKLTSLSEIPNRINGKGCSAIPGLIDSHTHPVWAGDRVNEFDLKLRGATYLEIHQQGGGIHYSVEQTKNTDSKVLLQLFQQRLKRILSCGTTVLECKSGYGLDYESELKMLKVISSARPNTPIELVSTFLGAHSVPHGLTSDEGVDRVLAMIDSFVEHENTLKIEFADVFCERGVYELEQSKKILEYARKKLNCEIAFHGDELCDLGAGEMGAKIGARSISHLEFVNDKSIKEMAQSKVAAILCPTTCYLLKLQRPPIRKLIDSGVPVVIASDFNPNAMCYSLPMAMNLASIYYGMTLNEALVSVTLNAAYALNRSKTNGSLEVGKRGDVVLINAPDWRHLVYQFGDPHNVIRAVIKDAKVVFGA